MNRRISSKSWSPEETRSWPLWTESLVPGGHCLLMGALRVNDDFIFSYVFLFMNIIIYWVWHGRIIVYTQNERGTVCLWECGVFGYLRSMRTAIFLRVAFVRNSVCCRSSSSLSPSISSLANTLTALSLIAALLRLLLVGFSLVIFLCFNTRLFSSPL